MSFPAEHTEPNPSCQWVPALLAAIHRLIPIRLRPICPNRHDLVLQLMNRKYLGAQPRREISRWAQQTADSAPGHCHRGDEDRSPSAQHPPPTGHSQLLWLKLFPLTVLLSSKATPWAASGREQVQVSTRARFPKGITLQVQSLPLKTGWPGRQNYFFRFPPKSSEDSHQFFILNSLNVVDDRLVCKSKFTLWWLP